MHRRTQQHVVNNSRLTGAGAAASAAVPHARNQQQHGMTGSTKSIASVMKESESGCDEKDDKETGDGDSRCMRLIDWSFVVWATNEREARREAFKLQQQPHV